MPLTETITVRHTEEEAGYVSVRPVVQETFRLRELADMVIRVTGKDPARVRQILRAGTVVYNGYRYWWAGFESGEEELDALLAAFPNDDPSRPFRAEECAAVLFEAGGGAGFRQLEITRAQASKKRFWRRSTWEALLPMDAAALVYAGYAHARGGDLYRRALARDEAPRLLREILALAPRALRLRLANVAPPSAVVYVCPRGGSRP
jgi:hypothetical protein